MVAKRQLLSIVRSTGSSALLLVTPNHLSPRHAATSGTTVAGRSACRPASFLAPGRLGCRVQKPRSAKDTRYIQYHGSGKAVAKIRKVAQCPDHLLIAGDFEQLRVFFAGMRISNNQVAAGKKLKRCHPRQRDSLKLVLFNAPHDFSSGRDLNHPVTVAATDQRIAILQPKSREDLRTMPFRPVARRARATG